MATGTPNKPEKPGSTNAETNRTTGGTSNYGTTGGMTGGTYGTTGSRASSTDMTNQPPAQVAQAIDDVSDKAKEAVDRASDSLKQTSATAAVQLQQAQRAMVEHAIQVKTDASAQLRQLAETLRSEVRTGEGQPVDQAKYLAQSLDNMANYLETHSFDQIESDLRHTIQRNPWQSVGVGVAVGWFLGKLFGGRR